MVTIPKFWRRKSRPLTVLDLPLAAYDTDTRLPPTIGIGEREVEPFVSVDQLKRHLVILAAFHALRCALPPDDAQAFPRRCAEAAKQYQYWAQVVLPRQLESRAIERVEDLPALEVLTCWHAHMLTPRVFERECDGAWAALKGREFPLELVAHAIETNTLPPPASLSALTESALSTTVWTTEEIGQAVERQAKFIANMDRIGWLAPGSFELKDGGEEIPLMRGIVRYHAWLDLMHSVGGKHFLVPTLDIDLAWHTHQLSGQRYKADTELVLGWFLNHDDNAGDDKLGNGLEMTGKLWKDKFGYNYQY